MEVDVINLATLIVGWFGHKLLVAQTGQPFSEGVVRNLLEVNIKISCYNLGLEVVEERKDFRCELLDVGVATESVDVEDVIVWEDKFDYRAVGGLEGAVVERKASGEHSYSLAATMHVEMIEI